MKQTLEEYIRQNRKFRQLLLKHNYGILKYWAEHSDMDFDADLFNDYEKQIVEDFLQANKQTREYRSLPTDKLREKSLEWYYWAKGTELKLLVALKSDLNAIDEELFENLLNYVERYMADAYKESHRYKYPEGIPPKVFYYEVIEKYTILGPALDCLDCVLREYRGKDVHISPSFAFKSYFASTEKLPELKELCDLQTEFDSRMFVDIFIKEGGYRKLRQAVKEIIESRTQHLTKEESREECRKLAKEDMQKFHRFAQLVNGDTFPVENSDRKGTIPLTTPEERHWLNNIMHDNFPAGTGTQKLTDMDRHFCYFLSILQNIGKIWAAQLLVHGIDMKELEKETGVILSRDSNSLYYVDRIPNDNRCDCCINNWSEAKELLKKINRLEFTWEEEKQCFKNAVLSVMKQKKIDGDFLFHKATQWKAIYRFAVDKGIMYDIDDPKEPQDKSTPQYAVFEKLAKELQFDVNPPTRLPFTKDAIESLNMKNYVRYNAPYPWKYDGLPLEHVKSFALYLDLDNVYLALQEEYNKLINY